MKAIFLSLKAISGKHLLACCGGNRLQHFGFSKRDGLLPIGQLNSLTTKMKKLMQPLRKLSWALLALVLLASCRRNDDTQPISYPYESGIFVANEGPFQNGTGTITWYHPDSAMAKQNIFQQANDGQPLGNIVQSLTFGDSLGYIVVNNAHKVVVVRANTFEQLATIEGVALPRYLIVDGAKGYLSQWGADGTSGSVAIIDLSSRIVEATIATGSGAESLLLDGKLLYVANAGGFGSDSTVAVIDLENRQLVQTIVVGPNPNTLVKDQNGAIWVVCSGNWSTGAKGQLVQIVNGAVAQQFEIETGSGRLTIDTDGTTLFFINGFGGAIWQHPIDATTLRTEAFVSGSFYSLGFDYSRGWLLASDAGDFNSDGEVRIYNMAGQQVDAFSAGIIPAYFAVRQ